MCDQCTPTIGLMKEVQNVYNEFLDTFHGLGLSGEEPTVENDIKVFDATRDTIKSLLEFNDKILSDHFYITEFHTHAEAWIEQAITKLNVDGVPPKSLIATALLKAIVICQKNPNNERVAACYLMAGIVTAKKVADVKNIIL